MLVKALVQSSNCLGSVAVLGTGDCEMIDCFSDNKASQVTPFSSFSANISAAQTHCAVSQIVILSLSENKSSASTPATMLLQPS